MIFRLAVLISVVAIAYGGLPDVGQCDENSAGLFPHPDECQLYFDCSSIETTSWQPGVKGLRECEYPKLFDEFSRKCMKNVQCGSRKVKKNGCDYYTNQCQGNHCRPCELDFPKCEGLKDGTYPHPLKKGSPQCIVCKNERFIVEKTCPVSVLST
ncbi:uncharacterized protein LOC128238944 [Mya arenaria]|uniref:uncharacterized protein LOC128238944 n=1 Tax=Mya arenaria TaxID=6604 RepID=UPI0022E05027|nr:uncharacterized protein LOC128238944 [Mya arenaria]